MWFRASKGKAKIGERKIKNKREANYVVGDDEHFR